MFYLTFTCGFLWSKPLSSRGEILAVEQSRPQRMVFSVKPFELEINTLQIENRSYQSLSIPSYGVTTAPGFPALPQTGVLVYIPFGAEVAVEVLESEFEEQTGVNVAPAPTFREDLQTGSMSAEYLEAPAVYRSAGYWPSELAVFTGTAVLRGREIGRIQINPVQFNPATRTLRIYRTLRIQVSFNRTPKGRSNRDLYETDLFDNLTRSFVLNHEQRFAADRGLKFASESDDWYNPNFTYYKLKVDEEGIYALTLEDFADAGVELGSLDLNRLKIYNQGKEIPIWVEGPQGATFTAENTLYFHGQRHGGADRFYDFYTDENVYWLTDDGQAGKRYTLFPNTVSAAAVEPFYWEVLHLEEENQLHRSNGSSEIDPEEGWIWRYFFDNDAEIIDFQLSGLFESVDVCSIRVRLQGTTRDPVNPDHHVRLSVNNEVIGDAHFDDQEELIWTLSFPTRLLKEGRNKVTMHLVPDTGARVNQIYLDWAEIIYPRLHAAVQSNLKFQHANPGAPSQYSLVNFRDATITVFDPVRGKVWKPESQRASFYRVESAGFDDGSFLRILADYESFRSKTRGHNLVAINSESGEVDSLSFDTFASAAEADAMAEYIRSLTQGSVVLAGIVDEGSASMTEAAQQALESLGSALTRNVQFRDSWALIGWKGATVGSVTEVLSKRFAGPAVAVDTLGNGQAFRFRASFSDTAALNSFYYAVSKDGAKKIHKIEKDQSSNLRNEANGADYIVITHAQFKSEAERLADYRTGQNGFRCLVVDVEDIYDEFSAGIVAPQAIKDFLTYASARWQKPAPAFVLLFGDASWDPKKHQPEATKTNYIPSYGILVADNWFVSLDGPGDLLPDMFIGRIPVETAAQAAAVVDKIISYERLRFDSWNKELAFLNGGINSTEQSIFFAQAKTLIRESIEIPPFHGRVTEFNKTTQEAITQNLRRQVGDKIKSGVLWVNFLGHAASTVWDIDIGQPDEWQNDIFPFMTGMSCHSARFANPQINSLSEIYLIHEMGAAAYWGSTGFGYITQDFFLLEGIFLAVMTDTVRRVGAAATAAKWHLWQRLGDQRRNRFVIDQYTLIGDPALKLVIPEKPELAVRSEEIRFNSSFLLTTDATSTVQTKVRNFGLIPQDSVEVEFSVFDPENNLLPTALSTRAPFDHVDSLEVLWNIPDNPGLYRVQVQVDPADKIEEDDELNNRAESEILVFSSDLTLIRPMRFGVVTDSSPVLVTNNSRTSADNLVYAFEIDTSHSFESSLLQRSPPIPEGKLVTTWQPQLSVSGVYFWRVRTFDGTNHGPWQSASFSFLPAGSVQWWQSTPAQFSENVLDEVLLAENGTVTLRPVPYIFEVESAGFVDGNRGLMWRNDEVFSLNRRGHNLAAFDETDGQILAIRSFDTFANIADAEAMAQFVNEMPPGRIVLAAINDEGSRSMTESAYLALESLGSALTRQVGFRDSWAIIGRKGAAIGSVPEAMSRAGDGGVTVADTVRLFKKKGSVVSPEVGPALRWQALSLAYDAAPARSRIEFQVVGKNRATGQLDSLKTGVTEGQEINLSDINAGIYPSIKLQATLFSEDGLASPVLESWGVGFEPPPDLVFGRGSVQVAADTVVEGSDIPVALTLGNFGLSAVDSFRVSLFTTDSRTGEIELVRIAAPGLATDEIGQLEAIVTTAGMAGRVDIRAEIDPDHTIAEINETNNDLRFSVWVAKDTVSPEIRVLFDGQTVGAGDFVSARPEVIVEIRDASSPMLQDTSQVTVLLDGQKVVYGNGPQQARFIPQQNPDDKNLKAVTVFSPELAEGDHEIAVLAEDQAGNLDYFQASFLVSSDFLITDVMNYPNPFRDQTEFTYMLTQDADQVRLKIYTVSGRLIREVDFLPAHVGFNQFRWDGRDFDGDFLANGVYLYKIIARRAEQQAEVVDKVVVVR